MRLEMGGWVRLACFGARTMACVVALGCGQAAWGQEPECAPAGEVASTDGAVEVQRRETGLWRSAKVGDRLCEGDTVRAGPLSRAALRLVNDAVLRVDQNTALQLVDIRSNREERSFLNVLSGAVQSFSRKPRTISISTPYVNASIEGTEFVIVADPDSGRIILFEGVVLAANEFGEVRLASGEEAFAAKGKAPELRIVVRPRDAVQWTLFYPPILALTAGGGSAGAPESSPALRPAIEAAERRDFTAALAALDRAPAADRDADFHALRAALLLNVGRESEAQGEIEQSLAQDPENGLAYALRSVIGVVQNRPADALADGEKAVALAPSSAAAYIALSYAQQANFRIEDARDSAQTAVAQQPDDALAWARLSSLWLMLGERGRSREAADRAVELAPDVALSHIVRGFAALSDFRSSEAEQSFRRAIDLDSASPLPRLGLGLAMISNGSLSAGTEQMEVATGLAGSDPIMRTYLGRAYFEQRRSPLDAEQYAIAKELDPNDPTPYLFDGIRKQTENQPIGAVEDLEKSIALNDERAVYRSRLLLDSDRAARQTSLARAYNDLGFTQLGVNNAANSLNLDPANSGAHRFLSDVYQSAFRTREVARVSELLQAQMLQDVNLNPVQPSIAATNLNLVTAGGPTRPGFNEFTPLFERNTVQLDSTGVVGNDNTLGGETVLTGVYDQFSLSAGGFYYNTDGWRDNNDLDHKIFNAFGQVAITPDLNVQAEYRRQHSNYGDLPFNFYQDAYSRTQENRLDVDIARVGARYSASPDTDVLLSYIFSKRDQNFHQDDFDPFFGVNLRTDLKDEETGNQIEGQVIHRWSNVNLIGGLGYNHVDTDTFGELIFSDDPDNPFPLLNYNLDTNDYRGYVYANINAPSDVTWTIGASVERYTEEDLKLTRFNPKLGASWRVTPDWTLRTALGQVVKPPLVANRTLEPTQVAGFNQYFDDPNATVSQFAAVGSDYRLFENVYLGGELSWRHLSEYFITFDANDNLRYDTENAREQLHRAYVYWMPTDRLAINTSFVYDFYDMNNPVILSDPQQVVTYSVPVNLVYFHPIGVFAGTGVTFVHQSVDRENGFSNQGSDSFAVLDAGLGYRFPKRYGLASFQVRNLLDSGFKYQDDTYREFRDVPATGPYFPQRTFLFQLTLNLGP